MRTVRPATGQSLCRMLPGAIALLIALAATSGSAPAQSLSDVIVAAPVIGPQPDGAVFLNVEAAAVVKLNGKQAALVNDGGGRLKIEGGCITRWSADSERPVWRFDLPAGGAYRVIVTCATPAGRGGEASLSFSGPRRRGLNVTFDGGGGQDVALRPQEMGEVELDAGEQVLEFRPTRWTSPYVLTRLADIRLFPLEAVRKSARAAGDAMGRMGIDSLPDVAALAEMCRKLQQEVDALNKETRRKDFNTFADFRQFFEFDLAPARLAEAEKEFRAAARQLSDLRLAKAKAASDALAKLKPVERAALDEYARAVAAAADAATKPYPKTQFPPKEKRTGGAAVARKTLFPTGRLEELPPQPISEKLPRVPLALQPPPDAAKRLERFKNRNSDAGLAELCREFQCVLIPGTPGLEEFERLCWAGKPREALEAYRAYFFAKLAEPEKFGAATQNILFELTRDRGKGHLLYFPKAFVVEANLKNSAVIEVRNEVVVGEVGAPGAVSWVPAGLALPPEVSISRGFGNDPFWRTEAGKSAARTLEFFRCLTVLPSDRGEYMSGGFFPALVFSYAVTGNKAHLARWCEYADDWCLNAKADQENFAYNTRNVTELEPQQVRAMLTFLRIVLDERPDLARDFDAPALARLTMKLVADYAPYYIRARRAEMANWGIMSMCHQLHLSRFLGEFKAMDYFNRESWRLWQANMIQHRTLDGENIEAWDDGHNWVDIGFALDSVPFARFPAGTDDLDRLAFWDRLRIDERSKMVHMSPGGNYWPFMEVRQGASRNTVRGRYRPDAVNRDFFDLVDAEPGFRNRLETLLSGGRPAEGALPDRFSDIAPYAAMAYLRDSWQPDADYFLMQNFRDRSQSQESCSRTMYTLSKSDRILVEAHGLVVDRKPDNRYVGKPMTGGKTEYCGQAGRNVVDSRFHTSARFDFAEARQDSPYARHRRPYSDAYGLYKQPVPAGDPEPITDVTVLRQAFGVRGEGLWIVCDRIENKGGKEREYTQFFTLPVRIAEAGFADRVRLLAAAGAPLVEENEKERRVRSASPGFENVSLYCFAPAPLKFANVLSGKLEHEVLKTSPLEAVQAALKAGRTPEAILKQPIQRPVSVRWSGAGSQVFVAALYSRPAVFDAAKQFENDVREVEELKGKGGVIGCRVVTRTGTEVSFLSGPEPVNCLVCGPVTAEAESLLVVRKADGTTSGIVLGCTALAAGGKAVAVPASDVEFEINAKFEIADTRAIRRPIDTIRILPEQNVFTDAVRVSFDIPTQKADGLELRYTLDGSEPTLASPLFTGPVALDKTTMVKVRAFIKGLKETPWHFTGTECSRTSTAIFRKRPLVPAQQAGGPAADLKYEYFEGDWPTLFAYAGYEGVLKPRASGTAAGLLDAAELAKIRATDRAYAVRYEGVVRIPKSGVYSFYAPVHLYTPTMDAGYDLRVFIDGEEWLPTPAVHSENVWCVPLAEGPHRLKVAFVDYRWKKFRNEFWMVWQEEEMWQGTPVLEVSGPGLEKQRLPAAWVKP